jgi:Flp pilus assembly protein TadG
MSISPSVDRSMLKRLAPQKLSAGPGRAYRRPVRIGSLARHCRRATAALEFALATPLLIIMLGGAADYGLAQFYKTNLANAVAAGAQYAFLVGTGVTSANIQSVITNAMYLPNGASGNLSIIITGPRGYCVTGSAPTMSAATAGSTCSDGSTAGTYVIISATYTNTGLMGGFWAVLSQPINESATIRLN